MCTRYRIAAAERRLGPPDVPKRDARAVLRTTDRGANDFRIGGIDLGCLQSPEDVPCLGLVIQLGERVTTTVAGEDRVTPSEVERDRATNHADTEDDDAGHGSDDMAPGTLPDLAGAPVDRDRQ